MASTSGSDGAELTGLDEYATDNSTLLSLHPWVFRKDRFRVARPKPVERAADATSYDGASNLHSEFFLRSATAGYCCFGRPRSPLRSRKHRRSSVDHLNSAENCVPPQLSTDDFEIEEFVFSPVSHQNTKFNRAFCITDGSQIISKSTSSQDDLFGEQLSIDASRKMTQFASLPKSKKTTCKNKQSQHGDLCVPNSRRSHKGILMQGSLDGLLCFCLGVTVGIASTMTRNKREVDKLNDLLKSKENLVQDLQEELEMKDSISVKELLNEACENEVAGDNWADIHEPNASLQSPTSCGSHQGKSIRLQPTFDNAEVRPGCLNDIEAELEAELERLELSFSASNNEGKMPIIDNPLNIFIPEKVNGELREDMIDGAFKPQQAPDRDSEGASTRNAHPVDYSVSPIELSIRLHEVIKSRLEERIKELEEALYYSQKQLHAMEADMVRSVNLNSEIGSSSGYGSPSAAEYEVSVTNLARPLCLNLSGDALDAYREAYDEFIRMAENEQEQNSISNGSKMTIGDNLFAIDGKLTRNLEDFTASGSRQNNFCENKSPCDRSSDRIETDDDEDDDDDGDDEGRILIEQIVKRVQKDSHVMLNAHQILSKYQLQ